MAKVRKIGSIENGIMQVLKILSDDEIFKAIGKTSSYLRKCSNPTLKQEIDHNDSIKLDLECIKKGKSPPLLTEHEYKIANNYDEADHKLNDIDSMLVKSTILHGKLQEVIKLAEDEKSEKGKEISVLEKKEIMEAITNLENKILKIKTTIENT